MIFTFSSPLDLLNDLEEDLLDLKEIASSFREPSDPGNFFISSISIDGTDATVNSFSNLIFKSRFDLILFYIFYDYLKHL